MTIADHDYETYSEAGWEWQEPSEKWPLGRWVPVKGAPGSKRGIEVVGTAAYLEHPSAEVLTLSYDLEDGRGVQRWRPGWQLPYDLFAYVQRGGLLRAHYSMFEFMCWHRICVPKYGFPPTLQLHQMVCSMATARVNNLPAKLGKLGEVLELPIQKDKEGKALLDRFSKPHQPTKAEPQRRITAADDPARFERLHDYNDSDVHAERGASSHPLMDPMTDAERGIWLLDQDMNWRGLGVDRAAVRDCIAVLDQALEKYGQELQAMTGGIGPSQVEALRGWLAGRGVTLYSLDAETVEWALGEGNLPHMDPLARRALEIRALVGSASVKKLYALENQTSFDDRIRCVINHHGANTGRPTGEGAQPLNMPRDGPKLVLCPACAKPSLPAPTCRWCLAPLAADLPKRWTTEYVDVVLDVMRGRSLETIEYFFGDAVQAIMGCLRGLFVAGDGNELIASDYSAIEAVVTAMLSGEQWRIDAFRAGEPIYLMSASKITGTPLEVYKQWPLDHGGDHHPDRQKIGKVAELACLTAETQVLTSRGYIALVDVLSTDKLWDGIEWVTHAGVVAKGTQLVINLDGVGMTPNHLINLNGSWMEARIVVSSLNTLYLALGTGMASFSSLSLRLTNPAKKIGALTSFAHVGRVLIRSLSPRCELAQAKRVENARAIKRPLGERIFGGLQAYAPMRGIVGDSLTASRRASHGANQVGMKITGAGGSEFMNPGRKARRESGLSWLTFSRLKGGTSRIWNWIASTLTGTTNRAIYVSSRRRPISQTSGQSRTCSGASMPWKPVFDIAHAGPRNRFVIKTDNGHLLVHNCGYGGWINSYKAFGSTASDDEIKQQILAWRKASPAIVEMWGGQWRGPPWDGYAQLYGYEGMAVAAIQNPGTVYDYRGIKFHTELRGGRTRLIITLLSGRRLTYHDVRLDPSDREWASPGELSISYMRWNTNPKYGMMGWVRTSTYGPKIAENVVQAVAHDIQRFSFKMLRLYGYPLVLGVYDENVSEVPIGFGSVEEYERIMMMRDWWFADWPVTAAGGWRGRRYRKA